MKPKRPPAKVKKKPAAATKPLTVTAASPGLLSEVREMILHARENLARAVDSTLATLYWHVGTRIRRDILKEQRAEYGAEIVQSLSAQLAQEFGRGFSRRNLFNMVRFGTGAPVQIPSPLHPRAVETLGQLQCQTEHILQLAADRSTRRRD